jgi:hypothetical protein
MKVEISFERKIIFGKLFQLLLTGNKVMVKRCIKFELNTMVGQLQNKTLSEAQLLKQDWNLWV